MTHKKLSSSAALALVTLIGAGCSSGSAGSSGSTTATRLAKAVQFSRCMRRNGVSAFPDPDASGDLTVDAIANGSSVDTSSATFTRAMAACKALEPAGFTGRKRSAQEQRGALEFARCIRENGVPDFPDPVNGQPLIDTNRIPSSNQPGGMTILNAAMQKCHDLAAQAGAHP